MLGNDWITLLSGGALAFLVVNNFFLESTDHGVGVLFGFTLCGKKRRAVTMNSLSLWGVYGPTSVIVDG